MTRNNTVCGVGVAYDARIAGKLFVTRFCGLHQFCRANFVAINQLGAIFFILQDCVCLEAA